MSELRPPLTAHEQRVYDMFLAGQIGAQIARVLGCSSAAVTKVKKRIRAKGYPLPGYEGVAAISRDQFMQELLRDLIRRRSEIEAVIETITAQLEKRPADA